MPFSSPPPLFAHIQLLDFRDQYLPPPSSSQTHTLILFFFFYRSIPPLSYTYTLFPKKIIPPNTSTLFFFQRSIVPHSPSKLIHCLSRYQPPPTHTHTICRTVSLRSIPPLSLNQAKNYPQMYCISCFLMSCTPPPKSLKISRIIHRYRMHSPFHQCIFRFTHVQSFYT